MMKNLKNAIVVVLLLSCHVMISYSQASNKVGVPKGRIENFRFTESAIFPGTQRDISVYIPAQLDPSKPACVYVQQDGFDPGSKFDSIFNLLISTKEMPVIVGVFIRPGSLSPQDNNNLVRPNRCFEYDAVDDSYVRFVLNEVLPTVAEKYKLKLSDKGNDRCISGCSSGGISAFNAAWQRPDAFSRVYCISGSFVAFRGGNEFPTLIRKTEAKPIRAFLSTGTKDMENCAGDWNLLDMEMDKALKFSGYEYQFFIKEGYHCGSWNNLFADGMRYLWKDWPEPVKKGTCAPRIQDIILPGESWEPVAEGYPFAHGPACNSKGEVYFTDCSKQKIYCIGLDGKVKEFISDAGICNSLSVGSKDEIYTVSSESGKIMKYDTSGKGVVYAEGFHGQYILARPDGGLYVSEDASAHEPGKIWLLKGTEEYLVDSGIPSPRGMGISPDQWLLAVADGHSHWVYSFEMTTDGKLINREKFFYLQVEDWTDDSGAESVCYDREGHLYVATRMGVQVCAWDGPTQVILPLPGNRRVTGLCFGGANADYLFAFCGDQIYKRKIKNHGIGAFSSWIKMTKGQL